MNRKKVGLVLGGGGARSFAHLGVADELRANNINIDYITSASMGSLMAAFIASDTSTKEIKSIFYSYITRINWLRPTFSKKGFMSQSNLKKLMAKMIKEKSLEDLRIPVSMIATDLAAGEQVVLEKGSIVNSVLASSAFPGIYRPIAIEKQVLADGGVMNSIPANVCRKRMGNGNVVISSVLDGQFNTDPESIGNSFEALWRSIYIPLIKSRKAIYQKYSDIVLKPLEDVDLNFTNWKDILKFYNPSKMEEFYKRGRVETKKNMKEILNALF